MLVLNCNSSLPCIEEIKTIFILKNTFVCLHFSLSNIFAVLIIVRVFSNFQTLKQRGHSNVIIARFCAVIISESINSFVHTSSCPHLIFKRLFAEFKISEKCRPFLILSQPFFFLFFFYRAFFCKMQQSMCNTSIEGKKQKHAAISVS